MPSPTKFYHVIQIVDVFMWPKFGNCTISMEKLLQPQFYKDLTRKTVFFEGWSWFKFNNLGLALSISLKFYSSVAKELKLKVRKFWELIPTFIEVTGEKLVGGEAFCPPSWIGLKNKLWPLTICFYFLMNALALSWTRSIYSLFFLFMSVWLFEILK